MTSTETTEVPHTVKPAEKPATKPTLKTSAPASKKVARKTAAPKTATSDSAAPQAAGKAVVKSQAVTKPVTEKTEKVKKQKMVRDSLTMPKTEYAVLDTLKLRAAKLENPVKKTELIRAGIKAIAAMSDAAFLAAVKAVPSLKTGRPAKAKPAQ